MKKKTSDLIVESLIPQDLLNRCFRSCVGVGVDDVDDGVICGGLRRYM